MVSKRISIITASVVIPIVIFGVFIASTDFLKEDSLPLETDKIPIYVPSDITKANPLFVKNEEAQDIWSTIHIEDVKDDVVYTLQGTVLSIDDPIDWNTGNKILGKDHIIGFIPITIAVEKVYKEDLIDTEFTFYVPSYKFGDAVMYNIYADSANFEIGENILIHLGHYDKGPFPEGHYYPKLSQFGKYQLQTVPSNTSYGIDGAASTTTNDTILAFNVLNENGVTLNSIVGEALS